jgi:hypothetical protein
VLVAVTGAAAAAAGAALGLWYGLDASLGRSLAAQLVALGAGLAAAGAVYVGAARALGIRELEALLLLRARRPEPNGGR